MLPAHALTCFYLVLEMLYFFNYGQLTHQFTNCWASFNLLFSNIKIYSKFAPNCIRVLASLFVHAFSRHSAHIWDALKSVAHMSIMPPTQLYNSLLCFKKKSQELCSIVLLRFQTILDIFFSNKLHHGSKCMYKSTGADGGIHSEVLVMIRSFFCSKIYYIEK